MNNALDSIMIGLRGKLLFAWVCKYVGNMLEVLVFYGLKNCVVLGWVLQDQTECTRTCFFDLEKKERPIFLKELKKVWLLRTPTKFSSSNTLLIDKEPYKALLNPVRFQLFSNQIGLLNNCVMK